MITTANIKRSQLKLAFALSGLLLLMTACPGDNDPVETPGQSSQKVSAEVEKITRDDGNQEVTLTLERNASKDQYTRVKDDIGVYAEIVRSGSKVTIKHGNPVPLYEADLNSNNRITQVLYDGGVFRLRNMNSFSNNSFNQLTVYNELLQPDSSYSQEPTAELSDINIDANGGTMVFTQFVSGSSPIVFDVDVSCLNKMNNLRNNIPFTVMLDFSDSFFNFVNQFDYCISGMNFTNRADNSTFSLTYQYKFDSKDRITERAQASSQQGTNDLTYRVSYYSN